MTFLDAFIVLPGHILTARQKPNQYSDSDIFEIFTQSNPFAVLKCRNPVDIPVVIERQIRL